MSAKAFREWAAKIWPPKEKYKPEIKAEYSRYSYNLGYESINTALRKVNGDLSELPNADLSKNWEGKAYMGWEVADADITATGIANRVAKMDEGMDFAPRVPETMVVSRGTNWREFLNLGITESSLESDYKNLVGKKYKNVAYTSTSLSNVAAMSHKDVQIRITIPPGMKAVNMAGDGSHKGALSTLPSENEFLLARNTEFKITKVTKDGWKWKVEVEVVAQS